MASIARPDDLASYDLLEDIRIDDFITTYMLKTCCIKLLPLDIADLCYDSACDWAIKIYERLEKELKAKKVSSWYDEYPRLVDCIDCKVECGCCKRRKLLLAMTSQILAWLHANTDELQDVQFLDSNMYRQQVYSREATTDN